MIQEATPRCEDCRVAAPKTSVDYTLSNIGWRCAVEVARDGTKTAVWRCSSCWAKRRAEEKTNPAFRIKVNVGPQR